MTGDPKARGGGVQLAVFVDIPVADRRSGAYPLENFGMKNRKKPFKGQGCGWGGVRQILAMYGMT